MKLLIIISQKEDGEKLKEALVDKEIRFTTLKSSGGFLRAENATFLIGAQEAQIKEILKLVKKICGQRQEFLASSAPVAEPGGELPTPATEIQAGGAIVFILPVEDFQQY